MLSKIGLIGGGNIGGVLMQEIVQRQLARSVAMVDIKEPELAKGKALDIAEGSSTIGSDVQSLGSREYDIQLVFPGPDDPMGQFPHEKNSSRPI